MTAKENIDCCAASWHAQLPCACATAPVALIRVGSHRPTVSHHLMLDLKISVTIALTYPKQANKQCLSCASGYIWHVFAKKLADACDALGIN